MYMWTHWPLVHTEEMRFLIRRMSRGLQLQRNSRFMVENDENDDDEKDDDDDDDENDDAEDGLTEDVSV